MKTGQITTTGSAVVLFDNTGGHYSKLTVKARTANAADMYVGNATVNATSGYELDAGQDVEIDIKGVVKVYVFGAASHTATFIAV